MSTQFEDFLGRSGKFGTLSFDSDPSGADYLQRPPSDLEPQSTERRIILLEEFPNTFTRTSNALQAFRSSILQYLAANTPSRSTLFSTKSKPSEHVTPLVMIISETLLSTTTAAADSFTAHRLLGHEILNHPGTSVIEFNPIAATFLSKALDLVIQKEARQSGRRRTPGPAVLKRLGEIGDVRSAIGSLEFLCVRGDESSEWSGTVAAKGKKGPKNATAMTKMEKESMEMVTQREATLGIFHAVGKVVYNKRDEVAALGPSIAPPPQPPDHLPQHVRLKVSQVNVNQLIDETGTDTQTFIAALHENYVLSCDDHSATDVINNCIDALSDSDLLSPNRDRGNIQGAATDSLRQDEICFQVAVRGILFALPCPVKRRAVPSVRGGKLIGKLIGKADAFKMFYPSSLRLWKQTEEIESLVDAWLDRSLRSRARLSESHYHKQAETEAQAQPDSDPTGLPNPPRTHSTPSPSTHSTAPAPLPPASSPRRELLLESLPYLTMLASRHPASPHLASLQRITQFRGMADPKDDEIAEDDDDGGGGGGGGAPAVLTERATGSLALSRGGGSRLEAGKAAERERGGRGGMGLGFLGEAERWVLSEDDIEDD